MILERAKIRLGSLCLILSAVLVMGLAQWSFLPLLLDSGPSASTVVQLVSAGHTSKFAAPFKCWFGDRLNPCRLQDAVAVPIVTTCFFCRLEEPPSSWDERFPAHRQFRAPPSV